MQQRQQRKKYQFHVSRHLSSGHYHHLNVVIMQETSFDHKPVLTITWQGDPNHDHWYASKVIIEVKYNDRWVAARNTLNSLIRWLDKEKHWDISNLTPELLAEWLAKRKMAEVGYDPRLSEHIELDQIQGPEIKRWMDNYQIMGTDGCTVSVLAETECEAKKLMLAAFTDLVDRSTYKTYDTTFARWLQMGRPVRLDTHASINGHDLRPFAEKMILEWVKTKTVDKIGEATE